MLSGAAGFPDFGMSVNPAKTRLTFDVRPGPGAPRLAHNTVVDGCGNEFVPWCACPPWLTHILQVPGMCLYSKAAALQGCLHALTPW